MLRRGTPATNNPARPAARATVLAFVLSAALVPRPGTSSSSATAPPPSRGVSPPPDVVLIVTDDQRASTLAHMPNLRKRLIDRGMRFRSAWVPNPACCPSRASYLTGTYSHTNGVWRNRGETGGFAA